MDISDLQATVTAGSCSSRVIFNVPKARSHGVEVEFEAAPNAQLRLRRSQASFNDSELRSTLTSTDAGGHRQRRLGHRGRQAAADRARVPAGGGRDLPVAGQAGRARLPDRHLTSTSARASRRLATRTFGTLNLLSFGANTIGGPLTAEHLHLRPELPAYDILNLRVGVRRSNWDIAFFVNNLTDERALLALDQERGTRARVGYLTNQPRTFGISTRLDF